VHHTSAQRSFVQFLYPFSSLLVSRPANDKHLFWLSAGTRNGVSFCWDSRIFSPCDAKAIADAHHVTINVDCMFMSTTLHKEDCGHKHSSN
jgi:hypothetical protein